MRSFRARVAAAGILSIALAAGLTAADPRATPGQRKYSAPSVGPAVRTPKPAQPSLLDYVADNYRDLVSDIVSAPTVAAKYTEDEFTANPKVYDWLLDHPDRAALAWQRLKIPCVDIADRGKGQFSWSDENGSELVWQPVGGFENGMIWFATGKVKAGALVPSVPVKAVAVLQSPRSAVDAATGGSTFKPVVNVYVVCDSKLASAALRVAGPAAPKMLEDGAEQLLFFFSGIARYAHRKPDQVETLLAPKGK